VRLVTADNRHRPAIGDTRSDERRWVQIIGIDPHKATHTAVAIGCDEQELAEIKVRATCQQTARLLACDVPATLASKVRVLGTGRSNKKRSERCSGSVVMAALRSPLLRSVVPADHGEVLRVLGQAEPRDRETP
jgi:transposase